MPSALLPSSVLGSKDIHPKVAPKPLSGPIRATPVFSLLGLSEIHFPDRQRAHWSTSVERSQAWVVNATAGHSP